MVKILGGIFVVFACTYTGAFMGVILKRRNLLLLQLQSSALRLRAQIRHERTPLPEALVTISQGKKGAVGEMFRSISRQMKEYNGVPTEEIWKANISGFLTETALTESDRAALCRLGSSIGTLDCTMQDELLSVYIEEVQNSIELLGEEIRRKTGFYRMMGVLTGIFITVMLL